MSSIFDALRRKEQAGSRKHPPEPESVQFQPAEPPVSTWLDGMDHRGIRDLEALCERIDLELPRTGRRVFAVTGTVAGEGASTLGLQLARMMSRTGSGKVLLVDTDFARTTRTLSQSIGPAEAMPGLADVLTGRVELSRAVLSTDEPNLHFLPSGLGAIRSHEVMASERMRQLLDEMGRLYGVVVLDCPPILNHPESPALAALSEGVVLVVRAGRTRREVARRGLALLQGARCKVLGIVLNARRYPIPEFIYRRL